MINFKLGSPTIATVQKVGNKSNEEGIAFASKVDDMSFASDFISALIKNTFKFDVFSRRLKELAVKFTVKIGRKFCFFI